jgi:DNA polymerase-3 subunit beta
MTEQMHFIVENEALAKALAHLDGVVRKVLTIPILTHLVLEAVTSTEILVRASNLDCEMEAWLPARVLTPGETALPGEALITVSKLLTKGGQLELTAGDGHAQLVSGSSKWHLRTLPAEDFPARQSGSNPVEFSMSAAELRAMLKAVAYAAAPPKSDRMFLKGIHLQVVNSKLVTVAADGNRLATRPCPLPDGAAAMPSITVPTEAADTIVALLKDLDGDARLAVSQQLIELRLPNLRFASLLVGGAFPDYRRVTPANLGADAKVQARALAEAVARVDVVRLSDAEKRTPILRFAIADGAIHLEAGAADRMRAVETVEAKTNGRPISFGINAGFLADALAALPKDSELGVQQREKAQAVLLTVEERPGEAHVVMPAALPIGLNPSPSTQGEHHHESSSSDV